MRGFKTELGVLACVAASLAVTSCQQRDEQAGVPGGEEAVPGPHAGRAIASASSGRPRGPGTVIISEFMAANDSGLRDQDGDYSDWIELHNYREEPVNLAGWYLTDDPESLGKWRLPERTLAGGGYVVIFASKKDRGDAKGELHTNFSLRARGDYLALVGPDGRTIVHAFGPRFPRQASDVSYGIAADWSPPAPLRGREQAFVFPTPGRANAGALLGKVARVKLDHPRGFFQEPFELTLSTKTGGAEIRYTLDGSLPGRNSGNLYAGPLRIDHTTVLRAAAFQPGYLPSKVTTASFIFPADVIHQSSDGLPPPGFYYRWGENRVDYGMDPEVVNDPRFSGELIDGLKSLPSFSLVMDLEDLFGPDAGIYANAGEDGRAWERPCSIEYLPAGGGKGFQIDCGIRIRGGFSRMPTNPKHAFRLFFRDVYGPSKLEYPLFGKHGARRFDNLDLRTFQNYSWSLGSDPRAVFLRDQFNRDLQLAMREPAARGDYCHLYINGQYWGLYDTCERPEASYGASYFGGKKESYDVIKVNAGFRSRNGNPYSITATDGNLDAWRRLYDQAAAGLESNAAYFRLQGRNPDGTVNPDFENLLDVDNLIDYMLVILYGGNLDSPITSFGGNRASNNWYGVRNRHGGEGFRFFIWDAEHTFLNVEEDRTGPFPAGEEFDRSNPQWIWQQCLENAEFRQRAADHIYRHYYRGGILTPESVKKRFLARARQIEKAVVCESARWGDREGGFRFGASPRVDSEGRRIEGPLNRDDDWRKEINRIVSEYIPRRSDIVLAQLYRHGLVADIAPPEVKRVEAPLNGGSVLAMKAVRGQIYYTTDGSDPRLIGGKISPSAREYQGPIVAGTAGIIKARVNLRGEWSALLEKRPTGKAFRMDPR